VPYVPDPENNERGETIPDEYPVDKQMGIVVHLPRGEGRCEARPVDLVAGAEGIRLCGMIRAWRKRKGLILPVST
jgi:hypothetical protein